MWSPQPTGSPLHRARWKSDLLICCMLRPWICRPAAAICCAIPARVCCLQRSCRWRSLPASWDTAPKFAAKPTSTSAKPNAPRPSTRLQNSISKNKFGERKWKMLTLPEKGGIVTLLNPGSETGGGNSKIPEPRQSDSSTSAGDAEASSAMSTTLSRNLLRK